MDRLLEEMRGRRLVIFAGAGLSTAPPTSLPSWWELQATVLDALGSRIAGVTGAQRASEITALLLKRQREERLPPEYQAQILADRLGPAYFDVLRFLDSAQPNRGHDAIAGIAAKGHVRAILTTNFDGALEAAFTRDGTPLDVRSGRALQELEVEDTGPHCMLLQIHGSASDPATLIDTLAQRRIGLPAATLRFLRQLQKEHHWLFVGWSGLDLAAEPNYLGLRANEGTAVGFTWLVRAGTSPRGEVRALVEHYGDRRGRVIYGKLPQWLDDLAHAASCQREPAPHALSGGFVRRGIDLEEATQQWAGTCDLRLSALAVADLLGAAGRPDDAVALLETSRRASRDFDETFALTLCALGVLRRQRGEHNAAEALFRQTIPLFEHDERSRAITLSNLGLIEHARGHWSAASRIAGEASEVYERIGDVRSRAAALHNAANALAEMADYGPAQLVYEMELELVVRCGDEPGRAGALHSVGALHARMGQYDSAEARLSEAQVLYSRLGDERGRAQTLGALGALDRMRGATERATRRLLEAISILERLGDIDDLATTVSEVARIAFDAGDFDGALRHFERELDLREKAGSAYLAARTRMNIGCTRMLRGDLAVAGSMLEGARTTFEQLGAQADLELARRNLETLARRLAAAGRYPQSP